MRKKYNMDPLFIAIRKQGGMNKVARKLDIYPPVFKKILMRRNINFETLTFNYILQELNLKLSDLEEFRYEPK
jgi:hypothetical protein